MKKYSKSPKSSNINYSKKDGRAKLKVLSVAVLLALTAPNIQAYAEDYNTPDYEDRGTRINDTIDDDGTNVKYKLFQNQSSTSSNGGAIYHTKNKPNADIISDFFGNSTTKGSGGAIFLGEKSVIGEINGKFNGNFVKSDSGTGGAIYAGNGASIKSIAGAFVNNYVEATKGAKAGAIYLEQETTLDGIDAYFEGNYLKGGTGDVKGGAIMVCSRLIKSIKGTFNQNHADASGSGKAQGGAVYAPNATITEGIFADFTGNSATSKGGPAQGGAVFNTYNIAKIEGKFDSNKVEGNTAQGGAIYNASQILNSNILYQGTISDGIYGEFTSNSAESTNNAYGGAVYNENSIRNIGSAQNKAVFSKNSATSSSGETHGGALYNSGTITSIEADFEENFSLSTSKVADGGAIYIEGSNGLITNIKGNFEKNYARSKTEETQEANGGAIYVTAPSKITSIEGNFTGNYVQTKGGQAKGGAIFIHNSSSLGQASVDIIKGDFTKNYATSEENSAKGGAMLIGGHMKQLVGDFSGNYAESTNSDARGGALYVPNGNIGDRLKTTTDTLSVQNESTDETISKGLYGSFENNKAISTYDSARGGAVYNSGDIEKITGKDGAGIFRNNEANGNKNAYGGAIYNGFYQDKAGDVPGWIGEIISDFYSNRAIATNGDAMGGAIYNTSDGTTTDEVAYIGNIDGDFDSNYAKSTNGDAYGGAIYNTEDFESFTSKFTKNYTSSTNGAAYGGAVYNTGKIKEIIGEFENNSATGKSVAQGGAIYNTRTTTIKNSSFKGNSAQTSDVNGTAQGGAIYMASGSLTVQADGEDVLFEGNYVQNGSDDTAQINEAIYINGGLLTLESSNDGNIIFNDRINGKLGGYDLELKGDETNGIITLNNNVDNANATLENVILKIGLTDKDALISDVFLNSSLYAKSGLVDLNDYDEDGNNIYGTYNFQKLTSYIEETDENDEIVAVKAGAEYSFNIGLGEEHKGYSDIFNIMGNEDSKGIIKVSGVNIELLEGIQENDEDYHIIQVIKNSTSDDEGVGRVQLELDKIRTISEAKAIMSSNEELAKEFALWTTDTTNDSIKIVGWRDNLAAWAEHEITEKEQAEGISEKIFTLDSSRTLTRDIVRGENDSLLQGDSLTIIGNNHTLNLGGHNLLDEILDGQEVSLANLKLINASENGITNEGTLNLHSVGLQSSLEIVNENALNVSGKMDVNNTIINNNEMTINGVVDEDSNVIKSNVTISGTVKSSDSSSLAINNSNVNITGAVTSGDTSALSINDSNVDINGTVENQNIVHSGESVTNLYNRENFTNNSLTMNGGDFNVFNLGMDTLAFNKLLIQNGNINVDSVTVDLSTKTMGRISAKEGSYTEDGYINVKNFSDGERLGIVKGDGDSQYTNVNFTDECVAGAVQSSVPSKIWGSIYEYDVTYANQANSTTGAKAGDFTFERVGFNAPVQAGPIAQLTGGYAGMLQVFEYAFEHADTFASLPLKTRKAWQNANKYAINEDSVLPTHYNQLNSKGIWTRSFTSFESIPLKNGPKISTIIYGTMVGGDGELVQHKNGWSSVFSAYAAYNGSTQNYLGNHTYQNGGALGVTETFYKNNFYTALTASAGASVGETSTIFGHEDFAMLMGGIASRSGYNWEFKEGKFIIQPTLLMSYTFINTFDYTNAAGVHVESDPLHALQVHPSVRFILNSKNGWQPYLAAGFVYNVMGQTQFRANDVTLPSLSIKPYAEYGLGLQRFWGEDFTGFAQAMVRSGGRNGVALTFGFRWTLGNDKKDSKPQDTVMKTPSIIKSIKKV